MAVMLKTFGMRHMRHKPRHKDVTPITKCNRVAAHSTIVHNDLYVHDRYEVGGMCVCLRPHYQSHTHTHHTQHDETNPCAFPCTKVNHHGTNFCTHPTICLDHRVVVQIGVSDSSERRDHHKKMICAPRL